MESECSYETMSDRGDLTVNSASARYVMGLMRATLRRSERPKATNRRKGNPFVFLCGAQESRTWQKVAQGAALR